MKRVHLQATIAAVFGVALPALALAQFRGPTQSPVAGNVPGVIWNEFGTGQTQTNATINISGGGTFGDDIYLSNTKAIRIDQNGAAAYYMGNWGGAGGTQKPLTFYMNGDVQVSDLGLPPAQGNRGRVQATEFCFNPGNPSDCIFDWSGVGSGLYVLKTGDTMSGKLTINTGGTQLEVGGPFASTGVSSTAALGTAVLANGGNYGVYAKGGTSIGAAGVFGQGYNGGYFDGDVNGVYAQSLQANGYGGRFYGTLEGVVGQAGSASGEGGRFLGGIIGVYGGTTIANGRGVSGFVNGANAIGGEFSASTPATYGVSSTGAIAGGIFTSLNGNGKGIIATSPVVGGIGGQFIGNNLAATFSNPTSNATAQIASSGGSSVGIATTGSNVGISSYGGQNGLIVTSPQTGAAITGGPLGLTVQSTLAGSVAGDFTGVGYGVRGFANQATGRGGYFSNPIGIAVQGTGDTGAYFSNNLGYVAYAAYPGYGLYSGVPSVSDYGLYTNGKISGGDLTVLSATLGTNLTVAGTATLNGNVIINGDFSAANNTLTNCSWQAYVADGTAQICPSNAPLMHGFQRNAANTQSRINCCDL